MPPFNPGLVHTPVTPFTRERAIDFDRYAKVIEFHLANGAEGLALPMHAGESVSLSDGERRALLSQVCAGCDRRVAFSTSHTKRLRIGVDQPLDFRHALALA